jgi:hypothetical protein
MGRVARLRANLAAWFAGSTVTDVEFDALDQRCYQAISETGGTYALEDPLVLGGDDVTIDEDLDVNGDINTNGGLNLKNGAGLYAESGAWISWQSGSHGTLYSGTYLTVNSGALIYVDGAEQIKSGASLSVLSGGALNVNSGSSTTLAGDVTVSASCAMTIGGTLTWGASNYPKLSSRTAYRPTNAPWVCDPYGSASFGDWTYDAETGYWLCTTTGARRLGITERVESAATLTGVSVYLRGASGHSALPSNMPDLALLKLNYTTGSVSSLGSWGDSSATVGAYEAVHPLSSGSLSETFGANEKLLIRLQSESGTNAVANMRIYDAMLTLTFDEMRPV